MQYRARFTVEYEVCVEDAETVQAAEQTVRSMMATIQSPGVKLIRLMGVIPAGGPWPDAIQQVSRPPRNSPPSGSPGTPTARLEEQPVPAIAQAA